MKRLISTDDRTLVERRFKTNLEQVQGFDFGHYDCPKRTYETLLRSKCVHMLGRTVDLSGLLAQSVNQSVRKSIDVAITRFEASDLNYVKDLESLLEAAHMTHSLLSQFLVLDEWEEMMIEVDERTGLNQYGGRIYAHLLNELTMDLCPNWCYNSAVSRYCLSWSLSAKLNSRCVQDSYAHQSTWSLHPLALLLRAKKSCIIMAQSIFLLSLRRGSNCTRATLVVNIQMR